MSQEQATEPLERKHDIVLVTGAAGFIGSRVTSMLAGQGVRVIALDNLYVGLPLPEASEQVIPVELDIRDRDGIASIMARYRPAVLHLAAVHHIPTCEREPALAFDVNVMGTQSVLDAAQAAGTRDFLLASSGAVYDWFDTPLIEDMTPLRAKDVYSITKLANEQQAICWAERNNCRAHVARLFNTIGTGDPNGHLIPDIIAQIGGAEGSARLRLGNTAPRRDYIHVDDVASGLVTMLRGMSNGPDIDVFNLCSGVDMSVAELVELMGDIMGVTVAMETDPARVRKVDRLSQLGSPNKMARRYGWRARWDMRASLAQIVESAGSPVAMAA